MSAKLIYAALACAVLAGCGPAGVRESVEGDAAGTVRISAGNGYESTVSAIQVDGRDCIIATSNHGSVSISCDWRGLAAQGAQP